ncbi:MAG: hypothetical protein J1E57_11270 [Prevotella sp.]|nr:hypothetical protein [Prevotella sp.]
MEKEKQKGDVINHFEAGSNCQVFTGSISGCVFAMPGATVNQAPVQQVVAKEYDNPISSNFGQENDDSRLLPETVERVFRFPSEYTKSCIVKIINEFYAGCAANLALIERVLYDHNQLKKNNQHKAFVQALVDWGIIDADTDITKTTNAITSKLRSPFPQDGYKSWGKGHTNDADTCKRIGENLPESMKYYRE